MYCLPTSQSLNNGVRQGGILSPLLFSTYMDDLSRSLQTLSVGCYMHDCLMNHLFYADDACLVSPSVKGMQRLLDKCTEYASVHDIQFNTDKSVCMLILKSNKKVVFHKNPVLLLNNRLLSFVDEYKYLGCILTSNRSDVCDIKRQKRAICVRANMLIRKFAMCSDDVKSQLFATFCQSLYCAHLWSVFDKKSMDKLRVTYNNGLRKLLRQDLFCSASWLFVNANVISFKENMRKSTYNFKLRVASSDNVFVKAICQGCCLHASSLTERWVDVLHHGAT